MTLEWLIVGGGIHGVHIAARLIAESGVGHERIAVVDPAERLLEGWRVRADTVGMTHLRSPAVHHLDVPAQSLLAFAEEQGPRDGKHFAGSYARPSLELFNAHSDHVMETFGIADRHLRDRVVTGSIKEDGVEVGLSSGRTVEARNVVLAVGSREAPSWPEWAPRGCDRVHHVFQAAFDGWPTSLERVVVVGGGISAAQVALRLVGDGHHVEVVSRHTLRERRFDSDSGWLGPRYMRGFLRERDYDRRRSRITEARHRGSVPPGVWLALCVAIGQGQIAWHEGSVDTLRVRDDGLVLRLGDRSRLCADRVLLATGFDPGRPGGAMVEDLITSASLPCAACGYPIVDAGLRWHSRLRVTGALAELELGPVARNIAGARRAGDRMIGAEWVSH